MNVNFFQWMRESVKHAVLLGVSDAIEDIGLPGDNDEENQKLLSTLQKNTAATITSAKTTTPRAGRKRLGRSLKDVGAAE